MESLANVLKRLDSEEKICILDKELKKLPRKQNW